LLRNGQEHVEQLSRQKRDFAALRLNRDRFDGLSQFGGAWAHHIGFLCALGRHASVEREIFDRIQSAVMGV